MASSRRADTEPRYMHASSRVSNSGISAEVYHNNWVCKLSTCQTLRYSFWFSLISGWTSLCGEHQYPVPSDVFVPMYFVVCPGL